MAQILYAILPILSLLHSINLQQKERINHIRVPQYEYEQSNGQIVDDMNGRVDIKSKGDEIEVADKKLSIMI